MHTAALKPIEREVKITVENFSKPPCCEVTLLFRTSTSLYVAGYTAFKTFMQHLKSSSLYWPVPNQSENGRHFGVPNQSFFSFFTLSFAVINFPSYWPRK